MKIPIYCLLWSIDNNLRVEVHLSKDARDKSLIEEARELLGWEDTLEKKEFVDVLEAQGFLREYHPERIWCYDKAEIEITPAQAFSALLNGKVVVKPEHRRMLADIGLDPSGLERGVPPIIHPVIDPPYTTDCVVFKMEVEKARQAGSVWLGIGGTSLCITPFESSAQMEFFHPGEADSFHTYTFTYPSKKNE